MPNNRSETKENRNSESRMKQQARTLRTEKAAKRPPSLNGINKQLP
ncbi:hypothetical protein [Paenibacillus abyssi]|uniref:Uncharacterized protein n=1 Tax=Paenibacillus abyssi TaxID=1340531 RepID=A0A917FK76_9BACL|nr:hypothetical protein [Paenibacillus abyssi]GGF90096.1 hypothetical protein GCM10010916_04320 [Paenibacillus abyssi]